MPSLSTAEALDFGYSAEAKAPHTIQWQEPRGLLQTWELSQVTGDLLCSPSPGPVS